MKNDLIREIRELKENTENNLRLYFYTKDNRLFRPEVDESFFCSLIENQLKFLINTIEKCNDIEDFDLDGNLDSSISYISQEESNKISDYKILKDKLTIDDYIILERRMIDDFYDKVNCVIMVIDNKLTLVKKFTYPKKLINNSFLKFKKYPLEAIEDDVFTIDSRVDIFTIDDRMFILNTYFFENIFSMESEYTQKINETKNIIDNSNLIKNTDDFVSACLKKNRNTKKLLKLLNENNFEIIKEKINQIEDFIEEYDLNITVENQMINFNTKASPVHLLNLLGDNYYISPLLGEKRVSQKNKKVNK